MTPPSARSPRVTLGAGAEFDLIRRFLQAAPPAGEAVVVGPGDDCAVVRAGSLALSTDASVEDVHFRRAWLSAEEIGWRAGAAALSDLAAVAARPIGLLASLAAAPTDVPDYVEAVVRGLVDAASSVGAVLLGGDLAESPGPLFLDVVVVGEAAAPVLRSGARAGDEVWVTGRLGAAAAAVTAWRLGAEPPPGAREAFARPRPRVAEALWLLQQGVLHAMIDLSDGLAGDLDHMAAASGAGLLLEEDRVPVADAARAVAQDEPAARRHALAGGEDYELCFAAPAGAVEPLAGAFATTFGLPLTRVARVVEGAGVACLQADGTVRPLQVEGYRHFHGRTGSNS